MILVDIGNSGLRAARVDESLLHSGTGLPEDLPVFQLSWSAIGQQIRKAKPAIQNSPYVRWCPIGDLDALRWLVRSVAGDEERAWRVASVQREVQLRLSEVLARERPRATIQWVTHRDVPMQVCVDQPDRLGIDRLLAARAARCMLEWKANRANEAAGPCIVVQAGTALTVDWVDEQGRFMGGAILPGVGLSLQYMAAGTDQLPWLPSECVDPAPQLPGKNTEQAIAAGVHASVVGGVRYLIDRYRRGSPIPVILSGGDGQLLQQAISPPIYYQKHLVLMGLALPLATSTSLTDE
jgi:type III pantothenate kinase